VGGRFGRVGSDLDPEIWDEEKPDRPVRLFQFMSLSSAAEVGLDTSP